MPALRTHPIKLVLLVCLGTALLWLVVTRSFVAYLATSRPELALRLNPGDSVALVNHADRRLKALLAPRAAASADDTAETGATATAPASSPRTKAFAARAISPADRGGNSGNRGAEPDSAGDEATRPSLAREELVAIRRLIERALARDPLNARALALLGHVAELIAPNAEEALRAALPYYERAARHSIRESAPQVRLLQASIARADYAEALRHADTLLRTRTSAQPAILPLLSRLAEAPQARAHLKALVLADPPPPWRDQFLAALPAHIVDPRAPLDLLLALKAGPHPPRLEDLKSYLRFLVRNQHFQLAYYTWLQFLPEDELATLGLVFNGDFDRKPSGLPFDWTIVAGAGVTAEVVPIPDERGQRAVRIEFTGGRASFDGMTQTLVLAPGRYVLTGRLRGEITGRRGTRWRIRCLDTATTIAETPMAVGPIPAWRTFEATFTVPASDCLGQQLKLELDARSSSEQLVSGTIWYDDIKIVRERRAVAGR